MLDVNSVADIQYLIGKQEEKEAATEGKVRSSASHEERVAALKSGTKVWGGSSYYDQESEADGRPWRPKLKKEDLHFICTPEDGKPARVGRGRRIADGIDFSKPVATKVARLLSMGYDPVTKERLIKTACAYHEKKQRYPEKMTDKDRAPRAGYDLTFSIDKPVSALWADALARGDLKMATAIEDALRSAVNDAKQMMHDNGMFRTRRVTKDAEGKRTEFLEPASDVVLFDFLHRTNRNGEPQLHVHSLLMNVCIRQDGSVGTIDDGEIRHMRPVFDAAFKASFYERLRQVEGLEQVVLAKGEHDIKIGGVKQELVNSLSTRRQEVLDALEERGLTTKDRRAAQVAAKATRKSKDEQPPIFELIGRWNDIIKEHTDGDPLLSKLEKPDPVSEDRDTKMVRVAMEAVERLGHTQTIVGERDVLTAVYRSAQGEFGLREIPEVVNLVKERLLVLSEFDSDGRAMWGIRDLVEKERSFMNMCLNLPTMPSMAADKQIEAIIDKYRADPEKGIRGLNDEQKAGIRYVLKSSSSISILEGSAGAGKSFTSGRIKEVLEPAGFSVYGISPSWKATDVLRKDMNLQDDMAKACAKFIAEFKVGKLKIDSSTIVAIDEAGMVGIDDMEFIAQAVTVNGGRLILLGDTQQLSPVAAGSPMTMARDVIGSHRLNVIMRQNDPDNPERSAQYREASAAFVKGKKDDIENALSIYRDEGRISFIADLDATYHQAADKFIELYDPKRPAETLIITNRNSDLHAINAEVRKSMIEAGMLGDDEVAIEALIRNAKDKEIGEQLHLRAGERVIFGERLETAKSGLPIPINNSDMATLKSVTIDPKTGEPILELVFDKDPAKIVRATPSQLTGFRKEGDKAVPMMQAAYCVTVYAAQGATVDQVIVADCHGMDYRLTYVGMTRHRHDCHLLVNVGRIEENKAAKAGIILVESDGHLSIPDKEDARQNIAPDDFKFGPEDWFKYIVHEASITDNKANFTDLQPYAGKEKLKAFLADDNWIQTHLSRLQETVKGGMQIMETRILNNKARLDGEIGASLAAVKAIVQPKHIEGTVNPFRGLKAPSLAPTMEQLGKNKENHMDDRAIDNLRNRMRGFAFKRPLSAGQTPVVPPKPVDQKIEVKTSKRISDAEKQAFYRADPVPFMLRNGAVLDPAKERQNSSDRVHLCDGLKNGEGFNRYTVSRMPDGRWIYNQWNDGTQKGLVDGWMINKGVVSSYPEAWHKLRDEFGTDHLKDTKVVVAPAIERPKTTYEEYKSTIAQQLASTSFKDDGRGLPAKARLREAIAIAEREGASANEKFRGRIADKWLKSIENGAALDADKQAQFVAGKARDMLDEGKSYHDFQFRFGMQKPWATDAYPKERGIERATINFFEDDVKRQVVKDHTDGKWKAGLAFAHRDVVNFGTITGYEAKLPSAQTSSGTAMRTTDFSQGEGKGLGMIGPKRGQIDTIVVAESGIDALSWWQQRKLPANFLQMSDVEKEAAAKKVPNDTLLLSTAGASSQHGLNGIELLAKANPSAKWVLATDNDYSGYKFREDAKAAVLKGNVRAEIKADHPSSILYKDWNDEIRSKIRSTEDLQKSADKMALTTAFVRREVEAFEKKHPSVDLAAYEGIGSRDADEKAEKAAEAKAAAKVTPMQALFMWPPKTNQPDLDAQRLAEEEARRQRAAAVMKM